MKSGSLQVRLLWLFEKQKAINATKCVMYFCFVSSSLRVEIGFAVKLEEKKKTNVQNCVFVGGISFAYSSFSSNYIFFSFLFHRHRKLNL